MENSTWTQFLSTESSTVDRVTKYSKFKVDSCDLNFQKSELPVLLFITFLFNVVSIIVLVKIRKNCTGINHFLVMTLALNDLVTTFLFSLMLVGGWVACGSIMEEKSCSIFGWLSTGMVVWSAWIIIIMTIVRYLATVKPVYYKTRLTITKLVIALVSTLTLTLLQLSLPFFKIVVPYAFYEDNRICAYEFAPGRGGIAHRVVLGVLASEGLLATTVVLYCNVSIVFTLRRKNTVHAAPSRKVQTIKQTTFKDKRTAFANVTKVVSVVYCLCYGPFLVRVLYDVIENTPEQNGIRHTITMILLFMSPLLNPLVYVACNKKYRDYILNAMKNCCSTITRYNRNRVHSEPTAIDVYTTTTTLTTQMSSTTQTSNKQQRVVNRF